MVRSFLFLAGLLSVIVSSIGSADELPLWEAGFGFTGLSMPDYRGSDEQRGYLFPLPYLVYRGDILRMDRKGMYGLLFQSERVELNISADAGVPVKSTSPGCSVNACDRYSISSPTPKIRSLVFASCASSPFTSPTRPKGSKPTG